MDSREPDEQLYTIARRYWLMSDALQSSDAEARARVDDDLGRAYDAAYYAAEDEARREDFLVALIDTRRNDDQDLSFLGAGWVEHVWHSGDNDILDKLRHRGVPARIIAKIDANLYR